MRFWSVGCGPQPGVPQPGVPLPASRPHTPHIPRGARCRAHNPQHTAEPARRSAVARGLKRILVMLKLFCTFSSDCICP